MECIYNIDFKIKDIKEQFLILDKIKFLLLSKKELEHISIELGIYDEIKQKQVIDFVINLENYKNWLKFCLEYKERII